MYIKTKQLIIRKFEEKDWQAVTNIRRIRRL
ncbi:hypothetical protein J2S11_002720 [Bacillus horti]|uniref:GNAT family N-acetyltransferase n=1 Tax=Caldalkalibacillus horti TaxID=77523 RepID=A0ABT9W142_9BACI|nr:hypothetical protein [Bacillus horti]